MWFLETFSYVRVAWGDSWMSPEDFLVCNRIVLPVSLFYWVVVSNCSFCLLRTFILRLQIPLKPITLQLQLWLRNLKLKLFELSQISYLIWIFISHEVLSSKPSQELMITNGKIKQINMFSIFSIRKCLCKKFNI